MKLILRVIFLVGVFEASCSVQHTNAYAEAPQGQRAIRHADNAPRPPIFREFEAPQSQRTERDAGNEPKPPIHKEFEAPQGQRTMRDDKDPLWRIYWGPA